MTINNSNKQLPVSEFLIGAGMTWQRWATVITLFSIGMILSGLFLLDKNLENKILPNTTIDGVLVGGMTAQEAEATLLSSKANVPDSQITLQVDDIQVSSSSAELGLSKNTDYMIEVALLHGKNTSFIGRLTDLARSLFVKTELHSSYVFDSEKIAPFLQLLAEKVEITGERPQAHLKYSGNEQSVTVFPGKVGRQIEPDLTEERLLQAISAETFTADAKVASTSSELSYDESLLFENYVRDFVGKSLTLTHTEDTTIRVSDQVIIKLLTHTHLVEETELAALITEWAAEIDREPQAATFEYNPDTLEVHAFEPDRNGRALDQDTTLTLLAGEILELPNKEEENITILLPVHTVEPNYSLEMTNNLGIKERIGFGESYYAHSIPTRINNVAVTAKRINNTLVAPGEEFSFNKTLGEVSRATGYQPAYVISNGKTELGDGGGVCQVSSTLFRSLLDAGLDITLRLPHSYRVSYYELNSDPGFDATVYSGNVDLRFKNDTDNYVLVHTINDPSDLHLIVELYGTSDGRTTEISDYQKWGATPPLPTEYIEDPSLPAGVKKQIDWAVSGLKAKFTHTVRDKDGNEMYKNTYTSNYRPWSAKYLVGTGG